MPSFDFFAFVTRPNSFQLMDTQVKIKPDPDAVMSTSLPSTSGGFLMRTNFKQQLQKEHLMQLDSKTQNAMKQMSVESNGLSIPRESSPLQKLPTDVPPGILKVSLVDMNDKFDIPLYYMFSMNKW